MPAHWLYNLPLWVLYSALTLISIVLSMGGVLLVHRRGWMLAPQDSGTATAIHSFIGVVYAVALALIVVDVQGEYHQVEQAIMAEVNALGDLYRTVGGLEQPSRERFAGKIRTYVKRVKSEEWPRVQQGEMDELTWKHVNELARGIIDFHPTTAHEESLYPELLSDVDRVVNARRLRLFLGTQGISAVTWIIIVIGAVITLGFTCFFPVSRRMPHLLMMGAMSALFGLILSLIVSMDRPLRGQFSLQPVAFQDLGW
jgi:hypothetical protein